ncbi:MotA/TolQ/ExbB proton channel family protein [uncultured Fusobacterium sp.]|mgnify:CR=1 FL=1|uniref:MotA/TolQ/ExbB proton channel family protein n=1 Tax=uncultured Fusobacterium sp. TaxID=159267 RepID=UPI0025DBE5C3|nr:MotA/TolQ/ExbB proton channel family protein [uncultured Fusobacterium sp.]
MYYLTNGGILMYVILIMSIIGIYAIIERFIYFSRNEKNNRSFLTKDIKEQLDKGNIKELIIMLNKEKSSVSKVLKEILYELYKSSNSSTQKLEEKGKEKAMLQLVNLEKNMWLISLAAHLTPLIGLLGTVTGMIKAFQAVSIYGTGDASILAKGISEALFTTAGGLFVAIPALIFYNYFNKKIEKIISDIEITTTELINYFRK